MPRSFRTLFAASLTAIATALAGCPFPTGALGPPTVGTLLQSDPNAHLLGLAGNGSVDIPLINGLGALVAFVSQNSNPGQLTVGIRPRNFELRLRRMESHLRTLKASRYRLAAVPQVAVGTRQSFWVIADDNSSQDQEQAITATAAYVGSHCYVFVDNQLNAGGIASRIADMGRTFDQKIFPTDAGLFGAPLATGVNGDPRITLLVTPVVGNYGRDTTIGYFTARDLYPPSADPGDPLLKHSNQRLMLYISSSVVSDGEPTDYLGTIAHEFQHLINASQRLFGNPPAQTEDTWLDEGLAMYAMEANGYGLKGGGSVVFDHVAAFEAQPASYSLTNWDVDPDQDAYGAAYLFTTYLADRFTPAILHELVRGPQTGVANVQARLAERGMSFSQVFADWCAANMLDHTGASTDPRYNYRSLSLLGTYGGQSLSGVALSPVSVPNTGRLTMLPYSAQYFYVPRGQNGDFAFSLAGGGQFGGWVLVP
ncbi:MAG TPA: hypothetical protein V6D47_01410 [Oscillatoriaceae cyanobacterium]